MSGFSPDWLALREPADHAARSRALLDELAALFADRQALSVVDLGCGTGSNLRGTMPALPEHQAWCLVDWDARLLAAARDTLAGWAGTTIATAGELRLRHAGRTVEVTTRQADLMQALDAVLEPAPGLVTAAAFFDLVSAAWIDRFAATLSARSLPLYTVLTYDGEETWSPPHPLDRAVLGAFHRHQGRDKGFGPAAGPGATAVLRRAFEGRGYRVLTAPSPWVLDTPEHARLVEQLAEGIGNAAAETGEVSPADARAWSEARRSAAARIGHWDLLAIPPGA